MNRQQRTFYKKRFLLLASVFLALAADKTIGAEPPIYIPKEIPRVARVAQDPEPIVQEEVLIPEAPEVPAPDYQLSELATQDSRQDATSKGDYLTNDNKGVLSGTSYGPSVYGENGDHGGGVWSGFAQGVELEARAISMRCPIDGNDQGNSGLDCAINWGSEQPVWRSWRVQAGARGAFTDLNGTGGLVNTDDAVRSHNQVFGTFGVYYRAPAGSDGFSGGVVYDILSQSGSRNYELSQLRAELSFNSESDFCELGFRGAFGLNKDSFEYYLLGIVPTEAKAEASSYYTMFARKRFVEGAEATVYGGATEWGEGLLGAEIKAPLNDSLSLKGSAGCVFSKNRGMMRSVKQEEAWNVAVGLSWSPGGKARMGADLGRPLFEVADNGVFLQNYRRSSSNSGSIFGDTQE
ncbi:MAG: hypothetical protein J6X44_04415, partial [Thermoguttaceae bacterium]|nr:hypothetical protein [Thermoguttaceae bacterium]